MLKSSSHAEDEKAVANAAKKASYKVKTEAQESKTTESSIKSKLCPPSSFQAFESSKGMSIQLVIRNAEGEELMTVPLVKKEFSTGSYGWTLSDKTVVENGEGGSMSISLNGNCVIQGTKPKAGKSKRRDR